MKMQKIFYRLYRFRWPLILSFVGLSIGFQESGVASVFVLMTLALMVFSIVFKRAYKRYRCQLCKGKGKLSKKRSFVITPKGTCYACHGEGFVEKTNYNEILSYTKQKRTDNFKQIKELKNAAGTLQKDLKFSGSTLKPGTIRLVEVKIDEYRKQILFKEKVMQYLDSVEQNVHGIMNNIHMLQKVQNADVHLNQKFGPIAEQDYKDIIVKQGRLEFDLSKLEGELHSMEHLLKEQEILNITDDMSLEIDQLTAQLHNYLKA